MPPARKKVKHSYTNVNDLADNDLARIFKDLPPYDRLIASEVCGRWHALSRKEWLDINHLDLSPIPGKSITAIFKQCPRVRSIFAHRKSFGLHDLSGLCKNTSIASVKFYDCMFELELATGEKTHNVFVEIFSDQLAQAAWTEFVLHDADFDQSLALAPNARWPLWTFDVSCLPASLTRLQIGGLYATGKVSPLHDPPLVGFERLQNLECLILHTTTPSKSVSCELIHGAVYSSGEDDDFYTKISGLRKLTELCVGPAIQNYFRKAGGILTLPNLQVLLLNGVNDIRTIEGILKWIITKNSVVRILVLTGKLRVGRCEPIQIPARKRFPNGPGAAPLPFLHVFVANEAADKFVFTESPSDALVVHRIDAAMPELLARSDVASIFEGVWVADKIKEAAQYGGQLWNYV